MRTSASFFFTLFALLCLCSGAFAAQNILLIIADDLGVDSCSLYNTNVASRPKTPAIQSLATNGIVFRYAYANPDCSPTRSCMMTGRYGFRTGIGDVIGGGTPGLTTNEFTLPEAFAVNSNLNFQLACFGKWHLANAIPSPNNIGRWPLYVGNLLGALTNYYAWTKTSNQVVNGTVQTSQAGTTAYATTDLVNNATSWIQSQGTNRWFAWIAFNAPHAPFQKPPTNLCPDYAYLSGTQSDINTNARSYFEAMIQSMDTEIARLLTFVDRTKTDIIFLGDNGTLGSVIQPPFPSSRGKQTLYEGGMHVPFVVSGPDIVGPGRTNDTLVNVADLYSTILELAGINVAAIVPAGTPLDSRSLLPIVQSTNTTLSRYAYGELFGPVLTNTVTGQTLRNDQYKLIRFGNRREEFYNLAVDPYEVTNLLTNAMSSAATSNYNGLAFVLGRYQQLFTNSITGFSGNSVTTDRNTNFVYKLWRSQIPNDTSWSPVTNAVITTNGTVSVMLTDTNPATGANLFYSVMSAQP
jgi:arylsulfatase A-like enzyme